MLLREERSNEARQQNQQTSAIQLKTPKPPNILTMVTTTAK